MLKGLLLSGIFFLCSFFGFYLSYRLRRRKRLLREIGDTILQMGEEIRYSNRPLSDLLSLKGKQSTFWGAGFTGGRYDKSESGYAKELTDEDWGILEPFFASLGKTDSEGQIKSCVFTSERLFAQEEKVNVENSKKCRLYSYSGILAGLFFVVLFFFFFFSGEVCMNIEILFQIAAVGIIVAVLSQILSRSDRPEQATLVSIAGLVIVLLMIVGEIGTLFDTLRSVFQL